MFFSYIVNSFVRKKLYFLPSFLPYLLACLLTYLIARVLIKFFSCEEGHSFKGGVHLGRGDLSDNYGKPVCNENL